MKRPRLFPILAVTILMMIFSFTFHQQQKQNYKYEDFKTPEYCNQCHDLFYQQWDQAMMSDAYDHHWDEIEYFKLAVPHSENDTSMAGVHEGCNGC
ncbi:MAG: hypothetical protein ACOCWA_07925, partial [Bacteroidota bacterium]